MAAPQEAYRQRSIPRTPTAHEQMKRAEKAAADLTAYRTVLFDPVKNAMRDFELHRVLGLCPNGTVFHHRKPR